MIEKKLYECYKCGGTGVIEGYSHIENGVCFPCAGKGTLTYKPKEKSSTPNPINPAKNRYGIWIICKGRNGMSSAMKILNKFHNIKSEGQISFEYYKTSPRRGALKMLRDFPPTPEEIGLDIYPIFGDKTIESVISALGITSPDYEVYPYQFEGSDTPGISRWEYWRHQDFDW